MARAVGTFTLIVLPLGSLAACSRSSSTNDSASSDRAFVRCMRAHGIADMPDPYVIREAITKAQEMRDDRD